MTEEKDNNATEAESRQTEPESSDTAIPEGGSDGNGEGYVQYLMGIFTRPDELLDERSRDLKIFGLINLGALVVLLALSSFVQRTALTSTSGVRVSWLINGIKYGLSFAIPLAIVLFVLNWYAKREGNERSVDFFIEKLGIAAALPAVLVALAIPLNLLGITMHSWFRGAGLFFIYIGVFMMSYLFAAPRQLKPAVVFALGFYFVYRLIWLLM